MIPPRPLVTRLLCAASIGLVAVGLAAPAAHAGTAAGPSQPASTTPSVADSSYPLAAELPAAPPAPLTQLDTEVTQTEWGPLGPADRDLIVRVRYAGLWEIPGGQLAAERGTTEQIREIGTFIAQEHVELDQATLDVAAQLGVPMPDEPHPDNQVFLDRMAEREGEEFDREFIQRLREAHGEIYPLIAYVRAGTQNDLVREFADSGEQFVNRHMEYLESSGLVDWLHIPPPPEPHGTKSRFLGINPAGVNPYLIWLILGAAAVAGAVTVVRTVRPR